MKKKASLITLIGGLVCSVFAATGGTLAWLTAKAYLQNSENPIEGSVTDRYYASGSGTSGDPFVINRPRHLYNLAWLQYLGFYNKHDGGIDDHQFYFKLGDNIDMSSIGAIPPIGTEDNPFVGSFDGQGYVISNLTISNDFSDYESHPSAVNNGWSVGENHPQPHILGFFGVVGYRSGNKPTSYSSAVNVFKNTGLTGVNVKTVLTDSLVGIAAGCAYDSDLTDSNNVLKNVVIDNSRITLPSTGTTTAYSGTSALTGNLSDYTLVGYTNNTSNVVKASKEVYGVNIDNNATFNATEDGNSEGWGGSIDMKSVTDRLQTILGNKSYTTFAYHKRYDYHEGEKGNATTVSSSNKVSTIIADTNHEEWGHFNFLYDKTSDKTDYALMGGGHYETNRYYEFYDSVKISTDSTHYLNATGFNNSSATVGNATSEADAATWMTPSATSGAIYTTGTSGNRTRTYYLRVSNNTTLSLTTTEGNATTFQRSEANGKVRFVYNGYYLDYSNGWKMVQITGAPTPPNKPEPPTPPESPILPPVPVRPKESDYYYNVEQIVSSGNYLKYSGSGNATFSSGYSTNPWKFGSTLTNGGTTTIYTVINDTNYYIQKNEDSSASVTFNTSTSSAASFTISESNGEYRFYYQYTTGWFNRKTYQCYLQNNNGTLYINIVQANNPTVSNASPLTTETGVLTDTVAYNAAMTTYNTNQAAYDAAVASYEQDMEDYEEAYQDYLVAVNVYETVTYPQYEADLATFMTTSAAFDASTHKLTVSGDASSTEYIDRETGGMNYDEDDVTYFPLTTKNNTSDFDPADSNTAYVVAGSNITPGTYKANCSNVRFSEYYDISLISDDYNPTTGKFLNVYTVNDNMERENITNNETDYAKLKNAKESLGKVMKGQSKTFGLHFMQSTISLDAITTAKYVKVNGQVHNNYQLPVNSIDFHLKEFGYINFVAASYYNNDSSDRNNSFFSLYEVERDPTTHNISRILEVKNVYQHSSRSKNYSYVYELTDGENTFFTKPYKMLDSEGNKEWLYDAVNPYSENQYVNALPQSYAKVFNVNRIKKNNIAEGTFDYHVYFFEIPMNDGEFCLGSVEGAVGSYLLYLDIGANAAKTTRTIFYEKFTMVQKTYAYPVGVSLKTLPSTYTSGTATININTTIDDSDSACMEIQIHANGAYVMDRTDNTVALTRANTTLAPPVYAPDAITLTGLTQGEEVAYVSMTSYDIVRMQYYDYMINTDTLCVTTFTDYYTTGNSPTCSRVVEQNRYKGNSTSGEVTSSLLYDPTGILGTEQDDKDDMKIYNTNTGIRYASNVFTDPTQLTINSSRLSSSVILEFYLLQEGGDTYTDVTTLEVALDTVISQTETYYTFDNYTIVLTPESGTITVKVISYNGSYTSYVYDCADETTSQSTITVAITINGETVTVTGQVITNPNS